MQQIELGKTGYQVSALCLGCMDFGTRTPEETAFHLADRYVEAGGSFFDTANNYAFWVPGATGDESETVLGRWIKRRGNRGQIFLASKVGARPTGPAAGFESSEGLSARVIERAVEASLTRLGTDYLDLYYAHIDDRRAPLEEVLAAFDRLVRSGKVRAIGCSNIMTWRIEQARAVSRQQDLSSYCCVQQRYTYLRPAPGADFGIQVHTNEELLDYCRVHDDITLLAYSPLLAGAYSRQDVMLPPAYHSSEVEPRLKVLHHVASEQGATVNQVILAWLLQGTPTILPLIAASTFQQLNENLGALRVHLTAEQIQALNTAGL